MKEKALVLARARQRQTSSIELKAVLRQLFNECLGLRRSAASCLQRRCSLGAHFARPVLIEPPI
jgi:hypothetical protein